MPNDVQKIIKTQAKRRRGLFVLGLAILIVVGSLWAALTREPLNPLGNVFDDGRFGPVDFVEEPFPEAFPVPPPLPPPVAVPFPPPDELIEFEDN